MLVMIRAIAIAVVLWGATAMGDGICSLRATTPKPTGPFLGRRGSDDRLPHQSIVFVDGGRARVLDPADAKHVVDIPDDVSEAMLLPARLVVVRDRRQLASAPGNGKPLAPLRDGDGGGVRGIDAVADGRGGAVAVGTQDSWIFVDRVDGAGKLLAHHAELRGNPRFVRVAKTAHGFAVAWIAMKPIEPRESMLAVAFVDDSGKLVGKTVRVDGAPGEQTFADVAIAGDGEGVVLAWNPFGATPDHGDVVPVDVRLFRVDATGAKPLRHIAQTTRSWAVAGAGGGLAPNALQAATIAGHVVLLWTDYTGDATQFRGLVVDGGAPVSLGAIRGLPLVRSRGGDAVALVEMENGFDLMSISCGGAK